MPDSLMGARSRAAPRALAPDLARGVMLLLIALAHAPGYLYGRDLAPTGPVPHTPLEQFVAFVQTELVTGRAYPMFAALFGYGIIQLRDSRIRAGLDPAVIPTLVRRRGRWLLVFGLAHALFLFSGDILGAYGVVAIVAAGLILRPRGWAVLATAVLSLVLVALNGATTPLAPSQTALSESAPLAAGLLRVSEWLPTLLLQPLGLIGAVMLGAWAARFRILEEPWRHRGLLGWVALTGLGTAVLGAVPLALINALIWPDPPVWAASTAGALHSVTGYGGVGYAALLGLAAIRVQSRPGPVSTALTACGQRSLSCYLTQSLVFVCVLAAYGGGMGDRTGLVGAAVAALAAWLLTVLLAEATRQRGRAGPAESLLRRLTYGSGVCPPGGGRTKRPDPSSFGGTHSDAQ